jgi:hypothetical protein
MPFQDLCELPEFKAWLVTTLEPMLVLFPLSNVGADNLGVMPTRTLLLITSRLFSSMMQR